MRFINEEKYICDYCGKIILNENGDIERTHTSYLIDEPDWSGGCIAAFDRSELSYDLYEVMAEQPSFHYCWTTECDKKMMQEWIKGENGWADCIYLAYALYYGRTLALTKLENCTFEELGIECST